MRLNELKGLKTRSLKNVENVKQTVLEMDEINRTQKRNTKKFKKTVRILPKENTFDFTESLEMQKEENEIKFALFFDLAEENKIIYNQVPINTLLDDVKKVKNGFFTNNYFTLGYKREIHTNRIFNDSKELAKFADRIFDKYDDDPSLYYTDKIYRYFRSFKRVNGSEHGRGVSGFNNVLEYEAEICYKPIGKDCFLECNKYFFKNNFSMEYFKFIQSCKRRTNIYMTR